MTDSWDLGFQDESILSLDRGGAETQLHGRSVGSEARGARPSRKRNKTQTTSQRRARQTGSSGLFEADISPFAYNPSNGPMSSFFSVLPAVIDAGIPSNTLNRDDLAWKR